MTYKLSQITNDINIDFTGNDIEINGIHTLGEASSTQLSFFTDSKYAYGLLMLNWKPRKNLQLVESIKKTMAAFKDVKIIKVKGHSGHPENEKADFLATSAIKKAR